MIFFTTTLNDDDPIEDELEEVDDSDVSVDDSVLDELSEEDGDDEEEIAEGFGAIDEDAEVKKADRIENGEDEDEEAETEEDVDDTDYDSFDDVDEM